VLLTRRPRPRLRVQQEHARLVAADTADDDHNRPDDNRAVGHALVDSVGHHLSAAGLRVVCVDVADESAIVAAADHSQTVVEHNAQVQLAPSPRHSSVVALKECKSFKHSSCSSCQPMADIDSPRPTAE
jgi:hypothetical protein